MSWLNRDKEREKLLKMVEHEEKPKERYFYFILQIDGSDLTFLSKEKNQIESRLTNLRDSYLKGLPFTFQVKELNPNNFSFDIEDSQITEIIIPNLREIKLIKKGEIEL